MVELPAVGSEPDPGADLFLFIVLFSSPLAAGTAPAARAARGAVETARKPNRSDKSEPAGRAANARTNLGAARARMLARLNAAVAGCTRAAEADDQWQPSRRWSCALPSPSLLLLSLLLPLTLDMQKTPPSLPLLPTLAAACCSSGSKPLPLGAVVGVAQGCRWASPSAP